MGLDAGARLGPYEVRALLGAGGMGEVYRARDPRLDRDVAIKVLPRGMAFDADRLERFQREARATGALNHPNILAVFDVGFEGGAPYVVSELLEGETLRERLRAGGLPLQRAIQHGAQIAHGLAAAHEKGIVHRDLKPENLFLTKDGRVKVLDFGLAKLLDPARFAEDGGSQYATASNVTGAGVVLGTVGYMSPEQARGKPADHRSDIFSFGAVLYEMLARRRAFEGTSATETLAAILMKDPPELTSTERPVPPGLERIVKRCLEKDPEHRFRSAHDLAFALEALSGSTPSIAGASVGVGPRRWRTRAAAAAVGLLGLAAGVGVALGVGRRPAGPTDEPVRFGVTLPAGASVEGSAVGSVIALSPDGRQLAFVAAAAGRLTRLWLRSLDALTAQPLNGTENAVSPFWSPDGRSLAFFSEGRLRKLAIPGGSPETLCDTEFATSGTWSAEGTILFSQFTGPKAGLWRIPASGGTPERVRTDAGGIESWPQFLPDGRHFLFLTGAYGAGPRLLHAGSVGAPASQRLIPVDSRATYVAGGRLIFARDGALMTVPFDATRRTIHGEATSLGEMVAYLRTVGSAFFAASPDGRALAYVPLPDPTQLTWLDRTGRPAGTVGDPARIFGVRLSPDGTKAVAHIFDLRKGARDIWVDDLERGVRSRLTAEPGDALFPIWDPRGGRIAFSSSRRGPPQVYVRGPEASGEDALLLDAPGVRFARDWSPDGERIALEDYAPDRRVRFQLWILELGPRQRLLPFAHGPANRYDPRFSPDGRHLAFTSEETGRPEVVVASLDGKSHLQVSSEGGLLARWRRDGRELFYMSPHGELVAVSVTPGAELVVGQRRPLFSRPVGSSSSMSQLLGGPEYDVTADGQRFLFNLGPESAQPSVVVLLGWQRALKP